jgi:type IV secretion system protein VirB7
MIRPILLLCMATALGGCASMTYPLPKCDGYSRRPLNRSMWQWEDNNDLSPKHSDARPVISSPRAASYAEEGKEPSAFAQFDIDASFRRCEV